MTAEAYLARIGIAHPVEPSAEALYELQRAHLFSVPYENLDILRGVPLSLDAPALYDKIVTRRRGGYCFELNELFGWLLRELGYGVTDHFARFLRDETVIPMRRHHVLSVQAPGVATRFLCDVGVGNGSPNYPVRIIQDIEQRQGNMTYRLTRDEFLGWVLEEIKRGEWKRVFSFTGEPQLPIDFLATSFYCEKSPDSPFNKSPMVAMRTERGRRTLDGDQFREFDGDRVEAVTITDPAERDAKLRAWFGLCVEWK